MDLLLVLFLLAVGILFCLLTHASLTHFSWSRLEERCSGARSSWIAEIRAEDDATQFALRIWLWLQVAAVVFVAETLSREYDEPGWTAAVSLGGWAGMVLLDLFVLQPIARSTGEWVLAACWPALRWLRWSVLPAIRISEMIERMARQLSGRTENQEIHEDLLSAVEDAKREASPEVATAARMMEGLIALPEIPVADVMTQRTDVVMVKRTATVEQARDLIIEYGHSRIPVYGENRDEIVGLLYAKDLLPRLGETHSDTLVEDLPLRKPLYVPESMRIHLLLLRFQKERVHMAIVLDEFSGVAGVVSIEDILEQIVGEIDDEHDIADPSPLTILSETSIEVDARIPVEDFNKLAPAPLPENEEYDTVGGFVTSHLGRLPKLGEKFEYSNLLFEVISADDRTVQRLRIEVRPAEETAVEPTSEANAPSLPADADAVS